jgi:hypothetical protein
MALKIITTLILSFSVSVLYSQHGTLLLATIRPDGIVIAADSRGAMYKNNDVHTSPIAYTDSLCKIYPFKQFFIAIAGAYHLGTKFIYQIIDDFNKTPFHDENLTSTIASFETYMDANYPLDKFPERKLMVGIAVGYVYGRPQLSFISIIRDSTMYEGTMSNDPAVYKYIELNSKKKLSVVQNTDVARNIEDIYRDFAIGEHKSDQVGGPTTIFIINPRNEIGWSENDFRGNEYKDIRTYINDIITGKKKVVYLTPTAKAIIFKTFGQ